MKLAGNKKFLIPTFICMMVSCIGFSFAGFCNGARASALVTGFSESAVSQQSAAESSLSFWDKLAQNWIWIVVGVAGLLLISLFIVLACVCAKKNNQIEEIKPEQPVQEEIAETKTLQTEEKEIEKPQSEPPFSTSEVERLLQKIIEKLDAQKSVDPYNDKFRNAQYTEFVQPMPQQYSQPMPQQLSSQIMVERPSYDFLLNILLNTQQDMRDVKQRLDYYEKNEAFAKQEAQLKSISDQFNKKADQIATSLQEQKEDKLKDKIESQQKELDEIKQDKLVDKIEERIASHDHSDNSIEHNKVSDLFTKQTIETNAADYIKHENEKQNVVAFSNENDDDLDFFSDEEIASKNSIFIEGAQKITLREAYDQLSKIQKSYFDRLKKYASEKPNARIKEAKTYLSVGVGNKNYIQLAIKKNTVIACFNLESEDLLKLRIDGKTSIKTEKTKVKIVDDQAFETARDMIDLRVEQVAREIENIKIMRKEKQKQRYENMKKKT